MYFQFLSEEFLAIIIQIKIEVYCLATDPKSFYVIKKNLQ